MYKRLLQFTYKMEQSNLFISIKKGLITLIPVLVVGSVALMLKSLPIDSVRIFVENAAGGLLLKILNLIYDATFGMMAVYLLCGISYSYAATFEKGDDTFCLMAMIASLGAFIASFGEAEGQFQFVNMGAVGVFSAIICAIFGTMLFRFFVDHLPRYFRSYAAGVDHQVYTAVGMIVPLFLCILFFAIISWIIQFSTGEQNISMLLSEALIGLFKNISNELLGCILFVLFLDGFWFFGMHGGNVMEQVAQLYFPAAENTQTIISKSFMDNFALMGGCGATLCLLFALLLFSKNNSNRRLAWSAAPFAIFNMNELLVFGLPVIFNPMMLVPFLLTPVISLCIAYFATVVGFLPVVTSTITWTTPVLFSGYAATGSIRGVVVQLLILAVGTAAYVPFIRLSERMQKAHEQMMLEDFTRIFWKEYGTSQAGGYIGRTGKTGVIAKLLTMQLREDVNRNEIPVFFQPQIDSKGRIVGAEALLRWQYHGFSIAPPVAITLSQEDGLYGRLTECILNTVYSYTEHFKAVYSRELVVSANVTARQLDDRAFVENIIGKAGEMGIRRNLCLEVTEEETLDHFGNIQENLGRLREAGLSAAIDDFSMGHTSLKYLQENNFQYVKLDGTLVRQMMDNRRSQDIVHSITSLGNTLNFSVVAEYVETEKQRELLMDAGCHIFQGYLFSPAVGPDEFERMLIQNKRVFQKYNG